MASALKIAQGTRAGRIGISDALVEMTDKALHRLLDCFEIRMALPRLQRAKPREHQQRDSGMDPIVLQVQSRRSWKQRSIRREQQAPGARISKG